MKIFLIHDPLRVDREKLYLEEFRVQGIDPGSVELIPADKSTSNPIINIARAHKNCIRRAQAEDLDQVMILEDDHRWCAPGAYNRFLEVLKVFDPIPYRNNWDIIIAGSYEYQKAIESVDYHWPERLVGLKRFSGLFCYIVNKRFYEKFLNVQEGTNLDKQLSKVPGINVWLTYPMLCLCHDGMSSNTGKITNYNQVYKNKINEWSHE